MKWLSVMALAGASAFCQNAPMFRGNLAHTGVYPGAGVRKFSQVAWKYKTGGKVISSPAVSGGAVYFGSTDQHLYAVEQRTGELRWKFQTGSRVTSSPAVAGGMIYFGSFDGTFYALDAATGRLKWKFETEGERRWASRSLHGMQPSGETMPDPWDFYLSSPAVFEGTVYFGSGDGFVYALDAASGGLKWKFRTGSVVHASPAIADGTLFIGSWDSGLYALEAASGKLKWRLQTGTDPQNGNQQGFQSSPAVAGGIVYAGCRDAKLYAVDARTGAKKWEYFNNGSWVITSPAVLDGKVYLGTSDTGLFLTLDAATGAKLNSVDARFPVFASPAIAGGAVYVGTFDGKLRAYDIKTSELLWTFETEASKQNAAAFTNKEGKLDFGLVVRANFIDEMTAGLERLFAMGSIVSSPAIDRDMIYVGSTDGYLYAL
ncbi:MAG TPA: PQQ-binding-like beta-propeller repeat protein, partial [Bryobacteraceae bacterium]|nr:PQQ-binding-like beta-propeller repeat protein [Bryobacteraceae bacterium]